MNLKHLPNGNLEMSIDDNEKHFLKDMVRLYSTQLCSIDGENIFFKRFLPTGFSLTLPELVGALTSAPLITNDIDVWGYMDYQVKSVLEELLNDKSAVWIKG